MPAINPTDLANAKVDVDTIAGIANSAAPTVTDRLGRVRRTLQGVLDALLSYGMGLIARVVSDVGFVPPVAYAGGISVTSGVQTVEYAGVVYRPKLASLPFTTGATFDPTLWWVVQNSNATRGNVAYVSIYGNDSTGTVGVQQLAFRQIDGALSALAGIVGPVVVEVLDGTSADYLPATTDDQAGSLLRNDLMIRTAIPGRFKPDCTALLGVAIPGPFVVDTARRSGFAAVFIGFDSGRDATDRLYAGQGRDGLILANLSQTTGITGMVGPLIDRITCLGRDDNVAYHALLVETTTGGVSNDVRTCYNLHGAAYKSTGLVVRGGKHYRCNGEAVIIKGDAYAANEGGQYSDMTLGGSPDGSTPYFSGTDLAGLKINPQGAAVSNLSCRNTRIRDVVFGVQFQMGGPNADNISLGDILQTGVSTVGLLIDGSGSVIDLSVDDLHMRDCPAVAVAVGTNPSLLRARIGKIRTLNSGGVFDMSASSQDLTIDTVEVRSIQAGSYMYHLGAGRIRIGHETIEPGSLAQKWNPADKPTYGAGWTTQVSGATDPTVNFADYGIALLGRANNGNGASGSTTIMQMPLVLGPNTPDGSTRVVVRGQLSTGPCTVGLVIGNGGGYCVVAIETVNGAAPNMALLIWVELTGVRWAC